MRFKELDALRGVACLFVVLFHYNCFNGRQSELFKFGVTGVDLFFMISGFVILMTLNKTSSLFDFIVSRFSRLYPAYWVCVTITALFFAAPVYKYWANMTMFQFYFRVWDIDGSYWTMIIEMLFYIYMGLLFKFGQLKKVELISGILLVGCFVYSLPFAFHSWGWQFLSYRLPIINHFPLFFAGILFYQMKTDKKTIVRWLLVICCFVVQIMLFDDGGKAKFFLSLSDYALTVAAYFIVFTLFVYDQIRFIANKVTVFLGGISFPLYLIHQMIGLNLIGRLHIPAFAAIIITVIAMVTLAYLINILIEKPSLRYIRDLFKTKSTIDLLKA